jgi:hypothetical protein
LTYHLACSDNSRYVPAGKHEEQQDPRIILGKALDPLASDTRHLMAVVAFLAWVGLGGTDALEEVSRLCAEINRDFPHPIFFTSKLIFASDNWLIRMLHNQASLAVQRRLHLEGWQMVNLPMKVWRSSVATEARAGEGRPRCRNLKANPIAHPYRQEGKAALHIRPSMATDFLPGYHLPAGGFSRYIFQFASTITKPTTCPHRYSPNRPAQPPLHCPC